jgi:hypothetical protein
MTEVCSRIVRSLSAGRIGGLDEVVPGTPRLPGAGSSLDWLREVTSRRAVTTLIDPSSTPGIKATAAPPPPLGSGVATVLQPERLDGMSNPCREQAEIHQGLLVRSGDRPFLSIVMDRTIRLPNDRARRGNATRGAIHVVRLSSCTSIPSLSRTGSQRFATHLASGDLAMFHFSVSSRQL